MQWCFCIKTLNIPWHCLNTGCSCSQGMFRANIILPRTKGRHYGIMIMDPLNLCKNVFSHPSDNETGFQLFQWICKGHVNEVPRAQLEHTAAVRAGQMNPCWMLAEWEIVSRSWVKLQHPQPWKITSLGTKSQIMLYLGVSQSQWCESHWFIMQIKLWNALWSF